MRKLICAAVIALAACLLHAQEQGVYLLHGFTSLNGIPAYKWKLSSVECALGAGRSGNPALVVRGVAEIKGGKAEVPVIEQLPAEIDKISVWIHAPEDAAKRPALFAWSGSDKEGESLMVEVPVDWVGWKRFELDAASAPWKQAWEQKDKNKAFDPPLKSLHFNWFSSAPGPQELSFEELAATTKGGDDAEWSKFPLDKFSFPDWVKPGTPAKMALCFNNSSDKEISITGEYVLFQSRTPDAPPCPDPEWGFDAADGCSVKTFFKDKLVKEGRLTNTKRDNFVDFMPSPKEKLSEMVQVIDLGKAIQPKMIEFVNSDANWAYLADVSLSDDGTSFTPVPEYQKIKLFHEWNSAKMVAKTTKAGRYLRILYHTKGLGAGKFGPGNVVDGGASSHFKLPCAVKVFDGVNGESTDLFKADNELLRKTVSLQVKPKSFSSTDMVIPGEVLSSPGCYLMGVRVLVDGKLSTISYRPLFVWEPFEPGTPFLDTPYGVNASSPDNIGANRMIGFSHSRFENMKWFMCSPEKGVYGFDGSVAPWHVNHDEMFANLKKAGLEILPMMLGVPKYASSKPSEERANFYPPKNPDDYTEFAFQLAARYGSKKHPDDKLLTRDKKSGLGLLRYFEIWNEPDLNHPKWGALIGAFEDYYPILRAGYEGVKKADPDAIVLNGGLAGFGFDRWNKMATHTYPDGTHPIDFVDIMNVHYYCGKNPPETASVNTNIDRSATGPAEPSFTEQVTQLCRWRDEHKPNAPVWMTEIGWDTIGGNFVTEREQAAYLVRAAVIGVAAGLDKLFIYRENDGGTTLYASCGFRRQNKSWKPSTFTVSHLLRKTIAAKSLGQIPAQDPAVFAYLYKKADGGYFVAAWSSAKEPKSYSLPTPALAVTDAFGYPLGKLKELPLNDFPLYADINPSTGATLEREAADAAKAEKAVWERDVKRKSLLIDFGDNERIGCKVIGKPRDYLAAGFNKAWDGKTYGFVKGGMSNDSKKWIKDAVLCDSVKAAKDAEFKVLVPAGTYQMNFGVEPFGQSLQVDITADEASVFSGTLSKTDDKESDVVAFLTLPQDTVITIATKKDYSHWRYLTFVEVYPEEKK